MYDAVRRQRQDVASFERLVLEPLALEAESEGDAGAERMLRQTRFLAATFRGYEARRDALGAHDEHTLRDWLMTTRLARPYRRVVVAVADQTPRRQRPVERRLRPARRACPMWKPSTSSPPRPCWPPAGSSACTTCCPGLTWGQTPRDVSSGSDPNREFVERFDAPRLLVPAGPTPAERRMGSDPKPFFVSRDREEELRDLVRRVRTLQRDERTRRAAGPHRRRLRPAVALRVPRARGLRARRRAV